MPVSYRIDSPNGIVWTKVTGVLTDEQLLRHKEALLADPAFRAGMKEISDVRDVERLDVTREGIRRFASFDAVHSSHLSAHEIALLVSDDLTFGLGRMYGALTEGNIGGVKVFRCESEVRSWAGLSTGET